MLNSNYSCQIIYSIQHIRWMDGRPESIRVVLTLKLVVFYPKITLKIQ